MVPVMKIRGDIDSREAVRFSVESKANDQREAVTNHSTRICSSGRLYE